MSRSGMKIRGCGWKLKLDAISFNNIIQTFIKLFFFRWLIYLLKDCPRYLLLKQIISLSFWTLNLPQTSLGKFVTNKLYICLNFRCSFYITMRTWEEVRSFFWSTFKTSLIEAKKWYFLWKTLKSVHHPLDACYYLVVDEP